MEEGSGIRGPDSKQLKITAQAIRFAQCEPIAVLRGHREPLVNLEVLEEGSMGGGRGGIFSASLDNTMRLWRLAQGRGECEAVMRVPAGQLCDARVLDEVRWSRCSLLTPRPACHMHTHTHIHTH